ncbi:MAG: urea ABC transporter permease subunit UrtB [Pseudomonadota bacterium]
MRGILSVVFVFLMAAASADDAGIDAAVSQLADSDDAARIVLARQIMASSNPRAEVIIEALRAGQLYERRDDGAVMIGRREGRGYELIEPVSGAAVGAARRRDVSRIVVSSATRTALQALIIEARVTNASAAARRQALDALLDQPDSLSPMFLEERLMVETDAGAKDRLQVIGLLQDLERVESAQKVEIIDSLGAYTLPAIRVRLSRLSEEVTAGAEVQRAAALSLQRIEKRLARYQRMQTVFFGLSLGSVLVLAAMGLAISFGVMGVINMAHGELIMLGAYTAWGVQSLMPNAIGWALLLALPAAFVVSGSIGILIERTVVRHLYTRPMDTLLATFGISLILQQTVRSLFGPLNRSVSSPSWMSGSFELVSGFSLTYNRMVILGFCIVVFFAVLSLVRYTRFGLELRAVSQHRQMARTLGVRSSRIDALTFGLGSGIAGIAGVALSQLTNVGPNLGQAYIVDSFLVVVVGGVGNLWGTLVAGLSIGVGNQLLEPATGAVMAKILLLVAIILFIQKRPAGLFPQRGRAAGD